MIVLDTNVLSAVMSPNRDERVVSWIDRIPKGEGFTTSITLYEIASGIASLKDVRRKTQLEAHFIQLHSRIFHLSTLVFDARAALIAGELGGRGQLEGRTIPIADLFIASIAIANGATIATRNVRHFVDLGAPIVNPWDDFH
jgi:predicted nucleic acid-binding protein